MSCTVSLQCNLSNTITVIVKSEMTTKAFSKDYIFLNFLDGDPLIPGSDVPGFRRRMEEMEGASMRILKESMSAVNVLDAAPVEPFASMYQCESVKETRATAPGNILL